MKWTFSLAKRLNWRRRCRLQPAQYDYEDDYRLRITHKVADERFLLGESTEKQEVVHYEVSCFATEGTLRGVTAQLDHREAMVAFCDNTEANTRVKHKKPRTVSTVKKESLASDPVTPEECFKPQELTGSTLQRAESVNDLAKSRPRPIRETSLIVAIGRGCTKSRSRSVSARSTASGSLSGTEDSLQRKSDVLHS